MTVTDEEKDLERQMKIERERLRNISGTVSQFEQIRRDAVLEIEKQQEEQLHSQKKLEDYEKQLRDLTTKRQQEELKKLKEELETLLVEEKNDVEEAKTLFTKLSKRNEMIERVKNNILKKKQQLKDNNIDDTSTDEIIKNIETTRARKFSFLVRTPSEHLAMLNQQVSQKEGKYPKRAPSVSGNQKNGGDYQLSGVTSKQLSLERQVVELNSLNQELERRLQGVTENFRQARSHHEQELAQQRASSQAIELQASEHTALAQQYHAQLTEMRGSMEQLSKNSTTLQQNVIEMQTHLQAKDKQLQQYLQEAQRAAQGNPVLNEAHMGRMLRMKVVELEETVSGRARIIEMLQQELSSKESTSTKMTEAAQQIQAQFAMLQAGKSSLEQKITAEEQRHLQEKDQLVKALENYSKEAQDAQTNAQTAFGEKQREYEMKISETMKQLDVVQNQNEQLETSKAEVEKLLAENQEELEKTRVQAKKLQSDLVETTEILQQQLNQATRELTKEFKDKQNSWAEERKRLDNAVQEMTEKSADLENQLGKQNNEYNQQIQMYQDREAELTNALAQHQAELEKSQKQTIDLAESLRLLQVDINTKAADWGEEKRQVELFIQNANKDFDERANEARRQQEGWESAKLNYENQIGQLTAQVEELTKSITELDEMTADEREQLQSTLLNNTKVAEENIGKLQRENEDFRKAVATLQQENETIERGWSDRFVQMEQDWNDRLQRAVRESERSRGEYDQLGKDNAKRMEVIEKTFAEERSSMEARIKQLQAEIERERETQDKIREENRTLRIDLEQSNSKGESANRSFQRQKEALEKEKEDANKLREKEKEQFVAERAQLENYLRSVSEHVKALQDSSTAAAERFSAERTKLEEEINSTQEESKEKQNELRKERDELQIEIARFKSHSKQELEQKLEEISIAQSKIARLEKNRDELENQLEQLAKTHNLSEQQLAEATENSMSIESRSKQEREEFEKMQSSLEETIKGKNRQVEELTAQLLQSQLQTENIKKDSSDLVAQKDASFAKLKKELEEAQIAFENFKKESQLKEESMIEEQRDELQKVQRENARKLNEITSMMQLSTAEKEKIEAEMSEKLAKTEAEMAEKLQKTSQESEIAEQKAKQELLTEKNQFDVQMSSLSQHIQALTLDGTQKAEAIQSLQAAKAEVELHLAQAIQNQEQLTSQLKNHHEQAELALKQYKTELANKENEISQKMSLIDAKQKEIIGLEQQNITQEGQINKLKNEVQKMHDDWKMHEQMLAASATNLKSQYENLASDASSKISERDGAINELKKEKLSFSQMVEESNRSVHQLKLNLERVTNENSTLAAEIEEAKLKYKALLKDSIQQKETISERDLALEKSKKELDRAKEELKQKEQRIFSAEEEISVLRDKSGGATKALSKEKKRLEEVEDSLQQALLAGKQREAQLNSEIESKEEFIHKLERKNAEMVRRLHQFDLEKDEMVEREERLNNLLSEGNETYGALQNEMESLKNQYERRLRTCDETKRENEATIHSLEVDIENMRARLLDAEKTSERLKADVDNKEREITRERQQHKLKDSEANERIEGLQHDLKIQQKTLQAVTMDLESQAAEETGRLERQIDMLKMEVESKDNELNIDILDQSASDLRGELEVIVAQLDQTRQEKNSLTVRLREQEVIDDELNSNLSEVQQMKQEREKLKSVLNEKSKEIDSLTIQLQRSDKRVEQVESEMKQKSVESTEAAERVEDARKLIQDLRREKDELVSMIGQRSSDQNLKFTQKIEKLREENRDLQKKLDDVRRESRLEAKTLSEASNIKQVLREKQHYQELSEDLKVEIQKLKNQMNEKTRYYSTSSSNNEVTKMLEKENQELKAEIRVLQQESRQNRQRSWSRSSALNSSTASAQGHETTEERRLKAENSLLVNRLRDLTDECRNMQKQRSMSRDEPNMSGVIEERDQLRGAIQKIASLRKMELQQIDQYKQKIADSENLEKELNDLKVKNTSQAEMVKVITIERERLLTEKTMLLQERDRILEERSSILKFAKSGEGSTGELCRHLEVVINQKQELHNENNKLRADNDLLKKDKQRLVEERDAAQFRVGCLEAEIAHPFPEKDSDGFKNQLAASALVVEQLREDVARLTAENQKLKGKFSAKLPV
ncbi:Oidioi.mRNA.OKI2018_I69.PAR.g12454.t1.cds [Oikopleura dioica]|uniref:Oidioi.mRNA.OKI2018_I69.PAR.g12454.t1.cds n=1 Tax=Oikopleura dioica TaxID=34765 RepID=A0ABN7S754_OIKDI|nr:Oidioi.mRNA.OKI2018_I69.PAR.g12454.t1.cds [Oikopleura dioica]